MPQAFGGNIITDTAQILSGVIVNSDINASAAIDYSKLALALSIVNADIAAGAAIVDTKLAQIATASKVSGAAITALANIPAGAGVIPVANVPTPSTAHGIGGTTRDLSAASGNQTIAHGLAGIPKRVRLWHFEGGAAATRTTDGMSDGTVQRCEFCFMNGSGASFGPSGTYSIILFAAADSGAYQTGTISMDATNITIAWTKVGLPTGTIPFNWHAIL